MHVKFLHVEWACMSWIVVCFFFWVGRCPSTINASLDSADTANVKTVVNSSSDIPLKINGRWQCQVASQQSSGATNDRLTRREWGQNNYPWWNVHSSTFRPPKVIVKIIRRSPSPCIWRTLSSKKGKATLMKGKRWCKTLERDDYDFKATGLSKITASYVLGYFQIGRRFSWHHALTSILRYF